MNFLLYFKDLLLYRINDPQLLSPELLVHVPGNICFMKGPTCVLYDICLLVNTISRNRQIKFGTVCELECILAGMSVEVFSQLHV